MLTIAILVSLKMIGALLVEALVIVPAAAARNIAAGTRSYLVWSVIVAFVAGAGGLLISTRLLVPTGGAVVLAASLIFFVTLASAQFASALAETERPEPEARRACQLTSLASVHPRLPLRHHPHFQQLDQGLAPLEQAVALEQRLLFERLEMLRDRVHEIGVGHVLRDEVVVAPLQLPREQLLEPLPRGAAWPLSRLTVASLIDSMRAMR